MRTGITFDLQEFAVHDGPGIRLAVFLKGCPLRCNWCHNPEGFSPEPQWLRGLGWERLAGREWRSGELAAHINGMAEIFRLTGGGVTFTGGEILCQADFLLETIAALDGVHVVADTSGYGVPDRFLALAEAADLVFFGLKLADSAVHRRFTGVDNRLILDNLAVLRTLRTPFIARIPLIPGVTDTPENLSGLALLLRDCSNLLRVELLPYNPVTGAKYAAVGKVFCPDFDERRPLNRNPQPFYDAGLKVRVV